jgi:DNA-binding NarL/FixJ family response regulator
VLGYVRQIGNNLSASSFTMLGTLSPLERDVLRGVANGLQSKEIANNVKRSTATVELNVRTLFAKFGARSRAHLVALAFCATALTPDDLNPQL